MVELTGIAHFAIPVSDPERSTSFYTEEDRQGGVIDGPRAYFRDPDGTALEFINRTAYAGKR